MRLHEIIQALEKLAPPSLQESYDNSGLLTGDPSMQVSGILVSLDCTESILEEAISHQCNVIVCHHPVIFSGLKSLTGRNYVERTVIKAIRNDIAIYAIHTNLDNVGAGVNARFAQQLGLINTRALDPLPGKLRMLVTYAPGDVAEKVRDELFAAGAGHISDYDECSFSIPGTGTFRPLPGADPSTGEILERHSGTEERIEVIYEDWKEKSILSNLFRTHPYEEVAYNVYRLENTHRVHGAGLVGELPEPLHTVDFLNLLKSRMKADCVRHTHWDRPVKKVAVCGGSGSFLLPTAIRAEADAFVSADFKYHQFFDADGKILIADIGHFESEQFTINLLGDYLREKFTNFAVRLTELSTNPINYF